NAAPPTTSGTATSAYRAVRATPPAVFVGTVEPDAALHCTVTVWGLYRLSGTIHCTRPFKNDVSVVTSPQPCGHILSRSCGPLTSATPNTNPLCHFPLLASLAGAAGPGPALMLVV